MRGIGWSGRLKYLFLLKSVVFYFYRDDVEFWDGLFIPWVHFVPIKFDGSDLDEKY